MRVLSGLGCLVSVSSEGSLGPRLLWCHLIYESSLKPRLFGLSEQSGFLLTTVVMVLVSSESSLGPLLL